MVVRCVKILTEELRKRIPLLLQISFEVDDSVMGYQHALRLELMPRNEETQILRGCMLGFLGA